MSIFDIIGPVMVGPSSSHTAGAARIGRVAGMLLDEKIQKADICLHGSFAMTGKGHGTDRAIVAGLMGWKVDDIRLPDSREAAKEAGIDLSFSTADMGEIHPNSVKIELTGESGNKLEMTASSIGGGMIEVCEINGCPASFFCDLPTLIVDHRDNPGVVSEVTYALSNEQINIAKMQLYRGGHRGGKALLIIESDQTLEEKTLEKVSHLAYVTNVTYLEPEWL